MPSPRYRETVLAISRLSEQCQSGQLTVDEFSASVTDEFYDYLADEDPRDDILGLIDYCVARAREVGELTGFADRVMPHRLELQLKWILDQQGDGQDLSMVVRRLRARLEEQDDAAVFELIDLCEHGYETHQSLFSAVDSEREVLELAYEFKLVAALDAAARPFAVGRLANSDKSRGQALPRTLDMLAHLANDPVHPTGALARDSLVGMCQYPETAGMAALRLPVHLLDSRQRQDLHDAYVAVEEGIGPDTVPIFISDQQLRDREILRSALWQTNDARHFTAAEHVASVDDSFD